MNARSLQTFLLLVVLLIFPALTSGEQLKPIQLPEPQIDTGRPLMQVLNDRKSSRTFSTRELPDQVLSDMLWAAFGENRQHSGKRTAPSAMNWQEIDIYVTTARGLYLYDAKAHALKPVLPKDVRQQPGVSRSSGRCP